MKRECKEIKIIPKRKIKQNYSRQPIYGKGEGQWTREGIEELMKS